MSNPGKEKRPLDEDPSQLASFFEAIPTGLMLIERETCIIRQVNAAAARMIGLPASDIAGKSCHDFIHPADAHQCPICDPGQEVERSEHILLTAAGDSVPILKTIVPLTLKGTCCLLESFIDLTEQKQMENALHLSEEKHRILFSNSPDPFVSFTPEGRYTYVNQAFAEGIGKSAADILGKTFWDVFPQEEADQRFALLSEVFRTGKEKVIEVRVPRGEGYRHYVTTITPVQDQAGTVQSAICSSRDITGRKQAEDNLKETETNYFDLFNTVKQAIYIQNPDSTFVNVNQGAVEMYGYEREYFIGKTPEFLSAPGKNDMEKVIELIGLAMQGHPQQFEFWGKRRDGSVFPKEVRVVKGRYFGKEVLITTATDITERKQAETALRESEQKYRLLFENAGDAIFIHTENGRILAANSTASKQLGYSQAEFLAMTTEQVDSPAEADRIPERTAKLKAHGHLEFETVHRHKDGSLIPTDVSARTLLWDGAPAIMSICRDISERKQAERALKDSEVKYRTLFETSSDGLLIADVETRKLLFANPAMCRMLGYSEEELKTKSVADIHPMDALPHIIAQFEAQARGDLSLVQDIPCLRKDGSIFPVDVNTSHAEIQGRLCNVGFFRDITERKRAEAERIELEAALQQSQKMESVGRLAGGVAHDFNNMLGVILGRVEMAMEQVEPNGPLHEDLTEVRKAAERSADFTRQLLAFARKQTIAPQALDLNESVRQIFQMLQRLIGESIELLWHPRKDLWSVNADPAQIDQILTNLCVNARDAIGDQGQITIDMNNTTLTAADFEGQAGFHPGDYVLLSVSDTGRGMDPETRTHIFEPFFTTKSIGKGTGLGLATAYGAVRQNKGFIDVISEPGKGSTFRVYLPRHTGRIPAAKKEADRPAPERGHETILIVEDEPAILNMTRLMLKRQGYHVLEASTPGEAIQLAREHTGTIHLLLTDVVMPEMNGRDLARNLLPLFPGLKRLFMSGYTADIIAHNGVLDKGVYFIQKPFKQKELSAQIRQALDSENA